MSESNFDPTAPFYKCREPYSELFFPELADRLECNNESILLDLACGNGVLSAGMNRYAKEIIAIDKSAEMLALANGSKNIKYIKHDLATSPFTQQFSVDHVLIGRAIPYIPLSTLDQITALLKTDGKIVICSSNFRREEVWPQLYKQLRKEYAKDVTKFDFYGAEKMHALKFRKKCSFNVNFKVQLDLPFLIQNALSYHRGAVGILNDFDNFRARLLKLVAPYLRNGMLETTIVSWAIIYCKNTDQACHPTQ